MCEIMGAIHLKNAKNRKNVKLFVYFLFNLKGLFDIFCEKIARNEKAEIKPL